ncbi:GumC family protein [Pannonibacter carbonis]|uniref:GumC family protein n=1 Tax=Pannonibacter carbonis TaxID=2067569 RepID=UPI001AD91880|nr:GumC family protein [Pannonibacter carbonis]
MRERSLTMVEVSDIPAILARKARWLVLVPALFIALALAYALVRTPLYSASAELLVEPPSAQILGRDFSGRDGASPLESLDVDSQAFVVMSNPVLTQVVEKLDLKNDPAFSGPGLRQRLLPFLFPPKNSEEALSGLVEALRKTLQVSRVDRTFVFQIKATHPNRIRAAEIANATAQAYLDETRKARAEGLQRTSQSLQVQAEQLRRQVEQAEAAVEKYRADNDLIATTQRGLVEDQQLQDLNTQLTQARVDLEKSKNTFDLVRRLSAADVEAGAIPVDVNNTVLSSLRVQYASLAEREARAATTLGANHPQMRELAAQMQNTRRLISDELSRIQRNIRSDYERAQANLSGLESRIGQLKVANSDQNRAQIELRQLEADADTKRGVYQLFMKRAQELSEQQDVQATNSRILSAAQPPLAPGGPSALILVAAAGIFGIALASGVAVGVEILSGRLNSERELVDWTGAPVLTNLPLQDLRKGRSGLFGRKSGTAPQMLSDAAELGLNRVAYALRYALGEDLPANILVLKTTTAIETTEVTRGIAASLYDMNEEVLLAHALPQATKASKAVEQNRGEGRGRALEDRSRRGQAAPHALSRYVSVERLDDPRKYAGPAMFTEDGQDFLLIDCGSTESNPILPVLLKNCDAIVLVSQLGVTRMADLDRTLAYLQPWQERVIGNVVLEAA